MPQMVAGISAGIELGLEGLGKVRIMEVCFIRWEGVTRQGSPDPLMFVGRMPMVLSFEELGLRYVCEFVERISKWVGVVINKDRLDICTL